MNNFTQNNYLMSTAEIKNSLHQMIDSFDENTLKAADNILHDLKANAHIYNEQLSAEAIASIEQGLKDVDNGDFVTLDEFLKNKEKWFTK